MFNMRLILEGFPMFDVQWPLQVTPPPQYSDKLDISYVSVPPILRLQLHVDLPISVYSTGYQILGSSEQISSATPPPPALELEFFQFFNFPFNVIINTVQEKIEVVILSVKI